MPDVEPVNVKYKSAISPPDNIIRRCIFEPKDLEDSIPEKPGFLASVIHYGEAIHLRCSVFRLFGGILAFDPPIWRCETICMRMYC